MPINEVMKSGGTGVFYGLQNYGVILEKQLQAATAFAQRYNSNIVKQYIDTKSNLILNNTCNPRKELSKMMRWITINDCDFIICYNEGCLFDNMIGKQNIKKFVAANQIPIILCERELLFHPLIS
ncbi:hypothetical protein [Paenibacillus sp. JDR-2]|uniref:hypothetical protein n=1 Tax=Paenibacillus sp. (strain JDR-2) TaxID=324057 RepID=UPI0001668D4C|nr:hypothetical protein [Paenibacillus sp. JDR-2]ACT03370.1 hypothetical protein Pjdr2_4757 [Paenibacillus sp. JDR-2]